MARRPVQRCMGSPVCRNCGCRPPVLPLPCQPALISFRYLHGTFPRVLQILGQMSPSQGLFSDHTLQTFPHTLPCFISALHQLTYFVFSLFILLLLVFLQWKEGSVMSRILSPVPWLYQ